MSKGRKLFSNIFSKSSSSSSALTSPNPLHSRYLDGEISISDKRKKNISEVYRQPPKKVIRAITDYTAKYSMELSFSEGDFFYVITDSKMGYFEVINPVQQIRGVVPADCFEVIDKKREFHSSPHLHDHNLNNTTQLESSFETDLEADNDYIDSDGMDEQYDPYSSYDTNLNYSPVEKSMYRRHDSVYTVIEPEYVRRPSDTSSVPSLSSSRISALSSIESESHHTLNSTSTSSSTSISSSSSSSSISNTSDSNSNSNLNSFNSTTTTSVLSETGKTIPDPSPVFAFDALKKSLPLPSTNSNTKQYLPRIASKKPPSIPLPKIPQEQSPPLDLHHDHHKSTLGNISSIPTTASLPSLRRASINDSGVTSNSSLTKSSSSTTTVTAPISIWSVSNIKNVSVQSYSAKDDGHYYYTIIVTRHTGNHQILFRKHGDCWALQITLLTLFPKESGKSSFSSQDSSSSPSSSPSPSRLTSRQRIIPFMPSPPSSTDSLTTSRSELMEMTRQKRKQLDIYFQELLQLPSNILESDPIQSFFKTHEGDIETNLIHITNPIHDHHIFMDDLIHDYENEESSMIKIKVIQQSCSNGDTIAFLIHDGAKYQDLLKEIQDRIEFKESMETIKIQFKDELREFVELKGDEDLRLLLKTAGGKLVLYI